MKKLFYLTGLAALSALMVVSCQDSQFSEQSVVGAAQEQTLVQAPHAGALAVAKSASAESMLQKQVDDEGFVFNRFPCFFFQYSPCDGIRYDVFGTCTIGVKETVLPSGAEQVDLQLSFDGEGQEYSLQIFHSAQFSQISNLYNVAGVRGVWNGGVQFPNFQTLSSGTVSVSNGTPVGIGLSTTSATCFTDGSE